MKLTSDTLNNNIVNARELIRASNESAFAIEAIVGILQGDSVVINGLTLELRVLYDIIKSLMLDSGIYEYSVDAQTLNVLEDYKFELDVSEGDDDLTRTATFKIIFPQEKSEE